MGQISEPTPSISSGISDADRADLLTQRLDVHEKAAWMLRSLLED